MIQKTSVKISIMLPFKAKKFNELERENNRLQKFVRILEKKFHDVIWYIGMDLFGSDIYERFTFDSGGFMEIKLGDFELNAYFDSKEKAGKFKEALEKTLSFFVKSKPKIEIKEGFIKLEDVIK